MRKLAVALLLVLVVSTVWSAWHPGAPAPQTATPSSSAPSTVAVPPVEQLGPAPKAPQPTPEQPSTSTAPLEGGHSGPGPRGDDDDGQAVAPDATAEPRDLAQRRRFATYAAAAETFVRAFARPTSSTPATAAQWWARVRPRLSVTAVQAYTGTDPQQVPFKAVTGPAAVVPTDAPSDLLTVVRVPTDAGFYLVEMETDEAGIHVSALTPEQPAGTP